ncbi:MAG: hypothetical protein Q9222_004721 [Ikaeria aurantiellina]
MASPTPKNNHETQPPQAIGKESSGQPNETQSNIQEKPNGHTQTPSAQQASNHGDDPDPSIPNPEDHISNGEEAQHPKAHSDSQNNVSPDNQAQPVGTPNQQASTPDNAVTAAESEIIDPKALLEPYQWDDLEERFVRKMEECGKREEEIEREFREWCLVSLWEDLYDAHCLVPGVLSGLVLSV